MGPFNNPTETYPYYSLPFCPPEELEHADHELGEYLSGDRKVNSPYDIRFRVNEAWRELCTTELTAEDVEAFKRAAQEDYYFEMFLDGLPIWGYVGDHEDDSVLISQGSGEHNYVYTHLHFQIAYNGDQVIAVNVSTDPTKRLLLQSSPLGIPLTAEFAYSVEWVPTTDQYEDRMKRYHDSHFLPASLEIHWLSIVNSLVLVVLLTAFLAIILLRVVKNDFTRYMQADDEEAGTEEESGWKLLHTDIFRLPPFVSLLCASVGAGAHLSVTSFALLVMALLNVFHVTRRGAITTAILLLYCLTAGVGGYVSGRLFRQLHGPKGTNWVWNIILTALIFPAPMLLTFAFLNTSAIAHGSTAALPFSTIMVVLALFLLVALPLTVVGGVAGHNGPDYTPPCRPHVRPRTVPDVPVYRHPWIQMLVAGFLPFSAISIELHYIFASIWGHRVYTLFGILLVAFSLLVVVSAFITVALTYFQLAAEDYRWWWRAFLGGGMVGVFIYAYAFFYFHNHSDMSGFLQTSFYFGYMANIAYAFFLMLGAVGFYSSFVFVDYIYSNIKIE